MAYVLGFFAADGYITKNNRGSYFFSVEIADLNLLENMKRIIQSTHKIGVRIGKENKKQLYRLQIGSKEICNDLKELGFSVAKTGNITVPAVPAQYFRDFVRGYFDGDGSVWSGLAHKERPHNSSTIHVVFTSCSRGFLHELRRRLRLYLIFGSRVYKGDGNYYRLVYSVKSSLKLYDFMYNYPVLSIENGLFLLRKRVIFERFIQMQP